MIWLWLKKTVPKWNPGKWKHGPKPAVCPSCVFFSHTHIVVSSVCFSTEVPLVGMCLCREAKGRQPPEGIGPMHEKHSKENQHRNEENVPSSFPPQKGTEGKARPYDLSPRAPTQLSCSLQIPPWIPTSGQPETNHFCTRRLHLSAPVEAGFGSVDLDKAGVQGFGIPVWISSLPG